MILILNKLYIFLIHTLIYCQNSYYNFYLITILGKKYIPFYAYTFFLILCIFIVLRKKNKIFLIKCQLNVDA